MYASLESHKNVGPPKIDSIIMPSESLLLHNLTQLQKELYALAWLFLVERRGWAVEGMEGGGEGMEWMGWSGWGGGEGVVEGRGGGGWGGEGGVRGGGAWQWMTDVAAVWHINDNGCLLTV